jgi:hypothetical protein
MSKKLFVGNLSFQTTETDISDIFTQYGAVESVQIITDRDTGRSKGFGFVVMDQEGANRRLQTFPFAGFRDCRTKEEAAHCAAVRLSASFFGSSYQAMGSAAVAYASHDRMNDVAMYHAEE